MTEMKIKVEKMKFNSLDELVKDLGNELLKCGDSNTKLIKRICKLEKRLEKKKSKITRLRKRISTIKVSVFGRIGFEDIICGIKMEKYISVPSGLKEFWERIENEKT